MRNILGMSIFFVIVLFSKYRFSEAILPDKNCQKKQCFEELGCFSAESFTDEIKKLLTSSNIIVNFMNTFLSLKNLLSICPESPDVMNVTFLLFTKESNESQSFGYNASDVELKTSSFSANRRTAFIIHGYTGYYEECDRFDCWMAKFKNYFISKDYNVVGVDWSKPASDINYFNSAFNTQIVGSMIAVFIKHLISLFGVKPETFHVIGHSLGAQVSGFVGKRFDPNDKIGQISGFDPAGPGFSDNRLSPNDAKLVVVTHTSAGMLKDVDLNFGEHPLESIQLSGFLGGPDALGHFDFWANGGNGQPGCEKFSKVFFSNILHKGLNALYERMSCSHQRATQLATVKQQNECQMIGYLCRSYADFIGGKCADCGDDGFKCKPLDFNVEFWTNTNNSKNSFNSFPNNYYFKTSESEPFCLFHYRIAVSIEGSSEAGQIHLKLIGRKEVEVIFKKQLVGFKSDEAYTQLITDTESWGQITVAVVRFDKNILGKLGTFTKILNPFRSEQKYPIKIKKISIRSMSYIDPEDREKYSSELTPDYEMAGNEVDDNYITFKISK